MLLRIHVRIILVQGMNLIEERLRFLKSFCFEWVNWDAVQVCDRHYM